jgi:hypothetical protein
MGKDCSLAIKTSMNGAGGGEEDAAEVVAGDGRVGPAVPGMAAAVSADNTALLSSMLSESQRKQEEMQRKTERLEERLAYLENVVMRGQAVGTSSSLSPAVVITHHSAAPPSQVDEVHHMMDAGERSPAPPTRAGQRMTSAPHFLIMAIGNDGLAFDYHETFFGMKNPDDMCPHPFKRGLVTKEQADVAFQV